MAILDDEYEQEIKIEDYIKRVVEETLQELSKENKEIASIAKTRIAELVIELQKVKELERALTEYKDNMNTITNKMINNIENYNKIFLNRIDNFSSQLEERLKEVKDTNQIFYETLEKSNIIKKFSEDVAAKTNDSFNLIKNNINQMKTVFYIFLFAMIGFLIFSGVILYKTNNRVESVEESLNNISSSLTGLVKGDLKFWYSEEDKKAYISNIENIKKTKDNKNKKK